MFVERQDLVESTLSSLHAGRGDGLLTSQQARGDEQELLVRSLVSLGATRQELAEVIGRR